MVLSVRENMSTKGKQEKFFEINSTIPSSGSVTKNDKIHTLCLLLKRFEGVCSFDQWCAKPTIYLAPQLTLINYP